MSRQPAWAVFAVLALGLAWLLVACATQEDLRKTSQDLLSRHEELRTELKEARQRSAELETSLREFKGQDLSQILGQLETQRRDIDTVLSGLDDQKAQVYSLEKKLLERLDTQDQRLGGYEKRAEATDRNVAQVNEKVREVGTKLSAQLDQHAAVLARLEEAIKQVDIQTGALSAEVKRFQGVLSEFDKILHALNDKATDIDRRVTDLTDRTGVRVGTLATQQGDQAVKLDALAKRLDADNQAMSARLDALEKTVAAAVASANDTARGIGQLKRVMEESVGKHAGGVEGSEAIVPTGPGAAAKEPSESVAQSTPASVLNDKEAYQSAHQQYAEGRYDVALTSFRSFLIKYPDSSLTPNAHFWIGECYVQARDYARGLEEYEHVVKNYPKSAKASAALYRKAMAFLKLNNKEAAKSALRKLIADYPKSEDSKRAKAKLASLK
jgi:tol-pal system protein YbgF